MNQKGTKNEPKNDTTKKGQMTNNDQPVAAYQCNSECKMKQQIQDRPGDLSMAQEEADRVEEQHGM